MTIHLANAKDHSMLVTYYLQYLCVRMDIGAVWYDWSCNVWNFGKSPISGSEIPVRLTNPRHRIRVW